MNAELRPWKLFLNSVSEAKKRKGTLYEFGFGKKSKAEEEGPSSGCNNERMGDDAPGSTNAISNKGMGSDAPIHDDFYDDDWEIELPKE